MSQIYFIRQLFFAEFDDGEDSSVCSCSSSTAIHRLNTYIRRQLAEHASPLPLQDKDERLPSSVTSDSIQIVVPTAARARAAAQDIQASSGSGKAAEVPAQHSALFALGVDTACFPHTYAYRHQSGHVSLAKALSLIHI